MKIRTITCHDVNNYGASLQALALQTYLASLGHDVKIIDYLPSYSIPYNMWKVHPSSHLYTLSKFSHIVKLFCAARRYFQLKPTFGRKRAFQDFNKKFLLLTRHYNTYSELAQDPPEADLYIAGSDQIWRTNMDNGKDPSYYLQFGDLRTRRISYAASFGLPSITDGLDFLVRTYLSTFDAISVRERSGMTILDKLGVQGTWVVDPVFLLNGTEWQDLLEIKERKIKEPYLLVYDLNHGCMKEEKERFATDYAKAKGLKIVAINDVRNTPYAQININDGSPVDFVNLIKNAEYVISDSFHATAFCTIMHTPFSVYFNRPQAVRISDFLSMLGLEYRMNNPKVMGTVIDWNKVQLLLDEQIKLSKDYLLKNMR